MNRRQTWVIRRIAEHLPIVKDTETRRYLVAMKEQHELNVERWARVLARIQEGT